MDNEEIGIGILGSGHQAGLHALAYSSIPGVKIVGFVDVQEEKAREYSRRYGAETWYRDYGDLLKKEDISAVSICLPNYLHSKATIDAAEAGKHILCEKPLALTLTDCDKMIEATKKAGVKLQIGLHKRATPVYIKAKSILDSGRIGYPIRIYSRSYIRRGDITGWKSDKSKSGSITVDLFIHACDLLPWFFGPVDSVYSEARMFVHKGFDVKDNVTILFSFENEALGTFEGSATLTLSPTQNFDILTSKGGLYFHPHVFESSIFRNLCIFDEEGTITEYSEPRIPFGVTEHYWGIRSFINSIRTGEKPIVTGEDGKAALEIALASVKSAETRRPVELPL